MPGSAGNSWTLVSSPSLSSSPYIYHTGAASCVDPVRGTMYIIGGQSSGGTDLALTYISTNGGATWINNTSPSFPGRRNSVCVVDSNERVYILAGENTNLSI